jgi:hypothetical protein
MNRRFAVLLAAIGIGACLATPPLETQGTLDSSDAGVYGLIHRDEHLTDKRYRMVQGTERWRLEEEGFLPYERAQRCPHEHAKKAAAWSRLLEPWTVGRSSPREHSALLPVG